MRTAENEPQREKLIQLFNFVEFIEKVKKKRWQDLDLVSSDCFMCFNGNVENNFEK